MPAVKTTIDIGLRAVLDDLSHQIEFARGPGGSWFGVFTMRPLSLNDLGARYLLELGVIEVLDWDDGPADGHLRHVPDPTCRGGTRAVRTRSRPSVARLSTDGWAIIVRSS